MNATTLTHTQIKTIKQIINNNQGRQKWPQPDDHGTTFIFNKKQQLQQAQQQLHQQIPTLQTTATTPYNLTITGQHFK